MHRFIALDTETTGTDFCKSQVIQCGVVFLDENLAPVFKKEWNINYNEDKFDWSLEAEEVHKISKEEAKNHGISPEQFIKEFEQEIVKRYKDFLPENLHIIAANAYFDYLMLDLLWREYDKGGVPVSRRQMDISALSLLIIGKVGMKSTMEYLGITTEEDKLHSALYDAELHLKVFHSLATIASKEGIALL